MAHDHLKLLGCAIAAAFWAGTGVAAEYRVPDSLRACAALTNDVERHACYDREMAKLEPEAAVAGVPVPATAATPSPTQAVPLTPEQRFGLSASAAAAQNSRPSESEPPRTLEAKVALVREISDGRKVRALIELDNGQVWRQIDTDVITVRLQPGDQIVITHNKFGSYWLRDSKHGWRVRRVR